VVWKVSKNKKIAGLKLKQVVQATEYRSVLSK